MTTWEITSTQIRLLFDFPFKVLHFVFTNIYYYRGRYASPYQKILYPNDEIKRLIETIKAMFGSMSDGEISVSAYDTAWVALVQDVNCGDSPQFPSSLEWIANNQLPDGSWGDRVLFLAHDRIINTLACVITLTSWNVHSSKCEKGKSLLQLMLSTWNVHPSKCER
ncbi:putative ent-copalyl diphosphate synthase [Helianthus annuus]|nr:putative ent-copalyl diphosphate synthase [Helianthus annuus]KAJ0632787.1 putative ent-copalyl diphosphate synthase [Helianthus annuus]KAJ0826740.1 putative ent-copalyl diphosphate synthase [Helianthus annuus]